MPHHDIIVIGASMGGVEALSALAAQLPRDLPAAVLVVLHLSPRHESLLPDILSRAGALPARHPRDGEALEPGTIYVAPNDRHLVVEPGTVRAVKGPRENGHRPAVDTLFRSAARTYGSRVVGVVLTGALDCGTGGLLAVKAQGGIAVVQEPADAYCPDMPRSALEYVKVDHRVRLRELGPLLERLVATPVTPREAGRRPSPSRQLQAEVKTLTLEEDTVEGAPPKYGTPSHFSCPDCGGVLLEMNDEGLLRFRCRTGHGYTARALVSGQQQGVDEALWAALRALEESAALARRMATRAREHQNLHSAERFSERAEAAEAQVLVLRGLVLGGTPQDDMGVPEEEAGPLRQRHA
ncbi:chemotaxis protein CheB [Pyxidicoccus xibeiensis]|uniref:chemotaxis protein CheB n=1 Tax=Pyxidicoccus xibeiensis TaxID=2906759 RepID=UPI0020A8237B|nr:chemotaxis protein CheB [Pyxidicoccus xibeiensis]MCP3136118.1 chemotaxis protein CheB [Pyxidicoccus xibeiensis]